MYSGTRTRVPGSYAAPVGGIEPSAFRGPQYRSMRSRLALPYIVQGRAAASRYASPGSSPGARGGVIPDVHVDGKQHIKDDDEHITTR